MTDRFPVIEVVLDAPGPVAATDLLLLEDERPTVNADAVRNLKESGFGTAIVFALDVSGTLAGSPLAELKRALLSPQDRVALVTFADDVVINTPFGAPTLETQVKQLQARGQSTELYKGLFKALALFEAPGLPARRPEAWFLRSENAGCGSRFSSLRSQTSGLRSQAGAQSFYRFCSSNLI